jgi:hypothetical protein
MKSLFAFFKRYLFLHIALVIAIVAILTPWPFALFGTIIYLPALALSSICTALGIRHFFFRQTLDADAASGWFVQKWQELPDAQRIYANLAVVCAFFIGICIIAAAMIR